MPQQNKKNIAKQPEREAFSERFRKLRLSLKLSQREFAQVLGLAGNTQISKCENASAEPSLATLRAIARVPADVHELIVGEPAPGVQAWQEEYRKVLELLAGYITRETGRLLDKRHELWGELSGAQAKLAKGIAGQEEHVAFLKSEIARIEERITDVAEDQHYVQEALLFKK